MNSTSRLMIDNPDSISELSLGAGILVPLLGRTSSTQAAVLSNGIAYTDNEWSISASEYMPDVEVEVESADIFYNKESTKYKVGAETHHVSFDNDKYADITNMYGRVSNNNFYYLDPPGPTASPRVEIKLQDNSTSANVPNVQIMSGRYDIQIVVVPQWYVEIANGSDIDFLDEGKVDSAAAVNKYKFRTQISYNDGAAKDRTSTWVISNYDGFKVDTITIAADFEFPYSYKNIRRSYPTLILEGQTSKNDAKNGFIYSLCIDKIILRSKEDGSETIVTP